MEKTDCLKRKIVKGTRRLHKKQAETVDNKENVTTEESSVTNSDSKAAFDVKVLRSVQKPFKKREYIKNYEHPTEQLLLNTPPQKARKRWETTPQSARQSGAGWKSYKANITPTDHNEEVNPPQTAPIASLFTLEADILPSQAGAAADNGPKKRRTYELEESIIDLSLLKSASKVDSRFSRQSFIYVSSDDDRTPLKPVPKTAGIRQNTASKCEATKAKTSLLSSKTKSGSSKKFASKVRMPNFAEIHKRAFEKMEDIVQYKTRKEERAQFLLSGQKPSVEKQETVKKEAKKKLRFAENVAEPSVPDIPLPNTPKPKGIAARFSTISTPRATPTVLRRNSTPHVSSVKKPILAKTTHIPKPVHSNQPFLVKSNSVNVPFRITKAAETSLAKKVERKQLCKDIIGKKATAGRNKITDRREIIKGVRSNRRFDLMMQMRALDKE